MTRVALCWMLVACGMGVEDSLTSGVEQSSTSLDQAPPPGTLELEVVGGLPGEPMTFVVRGALAGARVGVAVSGGGVGSGPCIPALDDLCFDLASPIHRLFVRRANASGMAERTLTVPPDMAGSPACFQAVEQGDPESAKSDVVCVVILDGSDVDCDPGEVRDCAGVCGGSASYDDCGRCVGGSSGLVPAMEDRDLDGIPDLCDACNPDGGARMVVQWDAINHYSAGGGPYTFQAVLHENGDFAYSYMNLEPYELTPTIGYQSTAGETFVSLAHHSEYPVDYPHVYFDAAVGALPAVEYVYPMEWHDIRYTGGPLGLSDDGNLVVDLGFTFPFLEASYEEVTVLSNGVLQFEEPLVSYEDVELPFEDAGSGLFVLWDDFNPDTGGEIYVQSLAEGCVQDCAGMYGGTAILDACGVCSGGVTGLAPDSTLDCAGECSGVAYRDDCGLCVGGTTGLEPTFEEDCPTGVDLVVDEPTLRGEVFVDYVDVGEDSCLVDEGCVRDVGLRRVLRFSTMIANMGTMDLAMGDPAESDLWYFDSCHGHYHFDSYARYDLRNLETGEILPIGAKTGFCVMDLGIYDEDLSGGTCTWYNCSNQGISSGCYDIYHNSLQCQWIDITDLEDGNYEVIVTTNPEGEIDEIDLTNNTATVSLSLVGDDVVMID